MMLLTIMGLSISPAHAADPVPGAACSPANSYALSGGPENSGVIYLMTCQGGVWVRVMETDTAGNVGIRRTLPKTPLDVGGEVKIGTGTGLDCDANLEGALRYNSGSKQMEYCNLSEWTPALVTANCDSTPDAFDFTDQSSLVTSTLTESNILPIGGTDPSCNSTVAISGTGTPNFRVCSTSDCSSVVQNWTSTSTPLAMNGPRYLQIRATTVATAGATSSATVSVGSVSNVWTLSTISTGSCGDVSPGDEGTVCADGSIYAGISPDGNKNMYVTRCDLGQSWDGSNCTGARQTKTWNNGTTNWSTTGVTNASTGAANTSTLISLAGNSDGPFAAAVACDDLNIHGQTDWYLPAANEIRDIYERLQDGTPNDNLPSPPMVSGFSSGSFYWHSTEMNSSTINGNNFFSWGQDNLAKSGAYAVRCARKD